MPTGKLVSGPTLLHVGERPRGDKKYATDEYVLAPPGTIVAPRLKGEEPTPENAARAIVRQGRKLGLLPAGKGKAMPNLPAYAAYKAAQGLATPPAATGGTPVGPPVYRRMTAAATGAGVSSAAPAAGTGQPGAAVNPIKDALDAIAAVSTARGVSNEQAASMLNTGSAVPLNQPAPTSVGISEGSGAMANLISQLLGGAQLTGPDLMLAQLAIMQGLGIIDPRALGITDPAQFRALLAEGQGMPTLDAQKQRFNESLFGFSQSAPSRGNVPTVASS